MNYNNVAFLCHFFSLLLFVTSGNILCCQMSRNAHIPSSLPKGKAASLCLRATHTVGRFILFLWNTVTFPHSISHVLWDLTYSLFLSLDRRYISWLSVVTLAFNYNAWLAPARFSFPYHTEKSIPYWIAFDFLFDLIYIIDIIIFRPRLQFVKGGDVIVSVVPAWGPVQGIDCREIWTKCLLLHLLTLTGLWKALWSPRSQLVVHFVCFITLGTRNQMQTRECAEIVVFIQIRVQSQEIQDSNTAKTKSKSKVKKQTKNRKSDNQQYK